MGTLLIAGGYRSPLFQAIDPSLGPASQPIDRLLEARRTASGAAFGLSLLPLVLPLRDHVPDPASPQPAPTLRVAIPFVARHLPGLLAWPSSPLRHPDRVQGRLQLRAVMPL